MSEKEKRKLSHRLSSFMDQVYKLRNSSREISHDFQRLPSRTGTDYYKYITKPISLHTIHRNVKSQKYDNAQRFIDDMAQITWNARHYNEPTSLIFENAVILDNFIKNVILPKLSTDKAVANSHLLYYPDLGPLEDYGNQDIGSADNASVSTSQIPTSTANTPQHQPTIQQHQQQQLQFQQPRPHPQMPEFVPQPVGMPSFNSPVPDELQFHSHGFNTPVPTPLPPVTNGVSSLKRDNHVKHSESGVKRGRPPIIDKPYESRIKAILKQFKKIRHPQDQTQLSSPFEKLPDKGNSAYYQIIEHPISLNEIRIKVRSRKYGNVEQFLHDLNLLLNNAKEYYTAMTDQKNFQNTQIFENEADSIIQTELSKPDSELIEQGADGLKTPLDEILVGKYSYRIGDWVLMKNPNDPNKPTVGQIFRLWSTEDGTQYTNCCWYVRPEQTVHRVDRLFFSNEVCKTGEYRDHLASDIMGPCYVIFLTHYQKGDIPEGLVPAGSPWFICEYRYNGVNHNFNRIRTWKGCLPDEIRQREQPVVPIDHPRKLIKFESPIKNLISPDAYIGMGPPSPDNGPSPNGPPIVGSVYLDNPTLNDELGQYSTSPHVDRSPEYDTQQGRKSYIFTPISQLKGGGGGATTVTAVFPSASSPNGGIHRYDESSAPVYDSARYDQLHQQSQPRQPTAASPVTTAPIPYGKQVFATTPDVSSPGLPTRKFPSPGVSAPYTPPAFQGASLGSLGPTYHTSKSTSFNSLNNGVLAYTLEDKSKQLFGLSSNLQVRISSNGTHENIWYRSPPVVVSSRISQNNEAELGHSATYLAWKISQSKR